MTFGPGSYRLSNLQAFFGDWSKLEPKGLVEDELHTTEHQWKTSWDGRSYLEGTISSGSDSWLITSIPYDEGFSIQVDGVEVNPKKVNTAFLGCELTKGSHTIRICYTARGFFPGCILSVIGVISTMILLVLSNRRNYFQILLKLHLSY